EPSGAFLRDLTLGRIPGDDYRAYARVIAARLRPALRSLTFSAFTEATGMQPMRCDVSAIHPALPNLTALTIIGDHITLGEIVLPNLRTFRLDTWNLSSRAAKSIAHARWPDLRTLDIQVGAKRSGAAARIADLQPILDGAGLPHLEDLQITNTELGDEL